jgi:hypothetical protein
VVMWEGSFTGKGGFGHRKAALEEMKLFLAQFALVGACRQRARALSTAKHTHPVHTSTGVMSGYNTSKICSRCGEEKTFHNKSNGIRLKSCACTPVGNTKAGPFCIDRDTSAGVKMMRTDEEQARGHMRPLPLTKNK